MILVRVPLRVSLFGGGSDYPEYYQAHGGGAVLGFAIRKYVYVGVKAMPPGQLLSSGEPIQFRVQYSRVDDVTRAEDVRHPAVRAALRYLGVTAPTEFHLFGDLPGRSGLGGSSACAVGLLLALHRHFENGAHGSVVDQLALAAEATAFERHVIGEAIGCQDQMLCALGGVQHISFATSGEITATRLPISALTHVALEASLVLAFTGAMRDSHVMAAQHVAAIPDRVAEICSLLPLVEAGRRVLLWPTLSLSDLGGLLHETWQIKRGFHPEVTTPDIDALYAHGLALGAYGGKLLGAGGGGYLLFCVAPERRSAFIQQLGVPCVTFGVANQGAHVLVGEPA